MGLTHRPIPASVREAAERVAARNDPKCERPSSNYSACPFCGAVNCHYAGPRHDGETERCMYLYWGDVCLTCAEVRRRSPDIFDWVAKTIAFVFMLSEEPAPVQDGEK